MSDFVKMSGVIDPAVRILRSFDPHLSLIQTKQATMTTIKQVPASLLHALGLHKGDFLTVRDESPSEYVVEITTALHPTVAPDDTRLAALARFASGVTVDNPAAEQELDDARYEALRAKHLK